MRGDGSSTGDLDMTRLLRAAAEGDTGSREKAYRMVYEQLRRLAGEQRRRWDGDFTLGTSALVSEAFIRLERAGGADWQNRGHFFAVASRAMRQVLLDHAKERTAQKRGGGAEVLPLADESAMTPEVAEEVLALNEALERLAAQDERSAHVVELRFFAGLTLEEAAETLGTSVATVRRDWTWARAWLRRELERDLGLTGEADD